jgi:histidinol phosphatase-like PHP family hydrolase
MYIDMHCHSVSSGDSQATVEQYVRWVATLRRKGFQIDGMVLSEHRRFDFDKDYSELAQAHSLVILKGSELDTSCGHFLVYGVTRELAGRIDFGNVGMDSLELMAVAEEGGAIAVPAHPGRFGIGLYEYIGNGLDWSGIRIVEQLSGSNRRAEQERADELVRRLGYLGTGGSDAHFVSAVGTCLTWFDGQIQTEGDLVRELRAGRFRALRLEDTKEQHGPKAESVVR